MYLGQSDPELQEMEEEKTGGGKEPLLSITVKTTPPSPEDDSLGNSSWLRQLTSLQELHGVDDGVVPVYAERHQDIGGGVEQHNLGTETRGAV